MLPTNDLQTRLNRALAGTTTTDESRTATANYGESTTKDQFNDILKNIELTGAADTANAATYDTVKHLILESRNNLQNILQTHSGKPKIRTDAIRKFQLILDTPSAIRLLDRNSLRCCFCKRIITFPVWYYSLKYAVNHFHYFICFDATSPDKPTAKCYKRDV